MLACALACLLLGATIAQGQVETARISGVIADPSGAVIPGAQITFVHVSTNTRYTTSSDEVGSYVSVPLRIGEYRIEVESDGFKRAVRNGIVLQVQQTAVINIPLEVGAVSETVDVTADAPLLEATTATQGQVINNQKIVDMPLNGRDYIQLALLSAGTHAPIGGRFGGFSAAGQRTTQNNYMLDGVDNNNVQLAAQGRRAEAVKPSIDAIQEFKVSTNAFSAEYGRATGGVVNATIKSGSNEIHGTVFEFLRNEELDAKNFFDSADADKPPFKRNQFGFSLGGPVIKNKTFFFGDYEGTRIRESRTVNNSIPTLLERSGDFSETNGGIYDPLTYDSATKLRDPFANNVIPASRFDRVSAQAKDWYPNPQNSRQTQNFLYNPPAQEDTNKFDIRIDQVVSDSDNVYWRYSRQRDFIPEGPSLPAPAWGGGDAATPFTHTGHNMALVWNHIFSPKVVTSTRVAWNKLYTDREPPIDYNVNAELGLTGVDQSLAGAPLFNISGVTNLGIGANVPNLVDSQTRQLISDTTWTSGKHSLKVGINFQWLQSYLANPKQGLGVFQFNGNYSRQTQNIPGGRGGDPFADFLLGIPRQSDVADPVYANLRAPYLQGYVQDEWRVNQRLTLNFGLRYEYNTPWVEKDNRLANFDIYNPELGIILAQDGDRFDRSTVTTDATNFAPRFGFVYRVKEKTVLRGGYGVFYANYEGTGGGRFLLGNPPYTVSVRISSDGVTIPYTLNEGVPPNTLKPENVTNLRLTYFERDAKWPLSQQWNFNIQREIARDLLWEVGYYGSKAQHLPTRWDGNFADPGPGNINSRRRFQSVLYPGTDISVSPLGLMDAHNYLGNSLFHSFQTRLEKRFSSGFSMLGSYIWSRTIGDVSGFSGSGSSINSGIQNPRDLRAERSLDNQHIGHRFVASYIYDLPFGRDRKYGSTWGALPNALLGGWTLSGINSLSTGQPMGLSVLGDPANTGGLNRPNVVGDPILSRSERTLDRFFNTDAFVANDPYTYGNAGRNILFEPGRVNWDFAVFKRFTLTERVAMQLRFEAFNFTNTPNFGAPNAQLGNNNFGVITSASRPRNLQGGLKFIF